MNQKGENGKKPRFGPEFGPFGPNSDCQFFFFFKNLVVSHGQLSSSTISEKTKPNFEKI